MFVLLVVAGCSAEDSEPDGSSATATGGSAGASTSLATGGTNVAMGGSVVGGAPASTGGSQNGTGGAPVGVGGIPAGTGGAQSGAGGAQNGIGGDQLGTGGTPAGSGGAQSGVGGTPLGSGGTQLGSGGTQSGTGGAQIGSGGTPVGSGGIQLGSGGTPIGSGGAQVGSGGAETGAGGAPTDSGGSGGAPILQSSDRDPTYAISGPWHGYIWPAVDWQGVATISPTAAEGFRDGGPPFCVEGHVPASSNSTAVAMVGMNTNQEQGNGPVAAQWMPTGDGILVNVPNPGGSPLRLQIQTDETGAVAEIWCAMITEFDQNVLVTWAELNTQCWSNAGTWYSDSMAGIATVMVLVPGTAEAGGYDFDFCVNELTPV